MRGIEHEKPAAMPPGFFFHLRHQESADAAAARGAMHQHLLDVGAVGLVGRRIQPELHRAHDFAVQLCRQQYGIACGDRTLDFAKKA